SRTHAKIIRKVSNSDVQFIVIDLESTCGTFVNGSRVEPGDEGITLSHGDIVSLGPSQISTYVFYIVDDESS
ncbi:unnamed protein product, partial [marine sediment metagenome]